MQISTTLLSWFTSHPVSLKSQKVLFPSWSCHSSFQTWPGRLFTGAGQRGGTVNPAGEGSLRGAPHSSVPTTLPLGVTWFAAFIFQD